MDEKTLEYMGERVDKARKLRHAISEVEGKIKYLKTKVIVNVRFSIDDNYTIIGQNYMGLPDNSIVSHIKEVAIKALEAYRDSLQAELDAI